MSEIERKWNKSNAFTIKEVAGTIRRELARTMSEISVLLSTMLDGDPRKQIASELYRKVQLAVNTAIDLENMKV